MYAIIPNLPSISVYKLPLPESSGCGGINGVLIATSKKRLKSFDSSDQYFPEESVKTTYTRFDHLNYVPLVLSR
jgi:hypothetical protein